jgi:hypothetical protein
MGSVPLAGTDIDVNAGVGSDIVFVAKRSRFSALGAICGAAPSLSVTAIDGAAATGIAAKAAGGTATVMVPGVVGLAGCATVLLLVPSSQKTQRGAASFAFMHSVRLSFAASVTDGTTMGGSATAGGAACASTAANVIVNSKVSVAILADAYRARCFIAN